MKPITEQSEIFKVEMWLVELQSILECEAETQPNDIKQVYLDKAEEIKDFLDKH